jgi:nucleoside-diphosphate-sugar epimerase
VGGRGDTANGERKVVGYRLLDVTETVLVTGGSGFIGGWCVATLIAQGYDVRVTARDLNRAPEDARAYAADLTADDGWDDAVAGCAYVLHVASPVLTSQTNRDALLGPAREGTLRVLRAAVRAGVRRVVLTSSAAAAIPRLADPDGVTDETVWTDADDPRFSAYQRAKTLAERAAWDFMAEHGGGTELTTVLPGWVLGPLRRGDGDLGSAQVVQRLLDGRQRALARIGFEVVDVRDVADLHLRAMTDPAAAGERFLGTGEFQWLADIADVLRERLGADARRVPRRRVPDVLFRMAARRDMDLRTLLPALGRHRIRSSEKARRVLDWTTRPPADAIEATARSLMSFRLV